MEDNIIYKFRIILLISIGLLLCSEAQGQQKTWVDDFIRYYDSTHDTPEIKVDLFIEVNSNAYLCDTAIMLDLLEKHNIKHKHIVLRQSVWESGWFECTQCSMRYNNPFGFRLQSKAHEGNKLGYLKFDCIEDAVIYYKKWQNKHYKGGDYYQFLIDRHYAHDSHKYVKHLKTLKL